MEGMPSGARDRRAKELAHRIHSYKLLYGRSPAPGLESRLERYMDDHHGRFLSHIHR